MFFSKLTNYVANLKQTYPNGDILPKNDTNSPPESIESDFSKKKME